MFKINTNEYSQLNTDTASHAAFFVAVAKPMVSGLPKSWMTGRLTTEKTIGVKRPNHEKG